MLSLLPPFPTRAVAWLALLAVALPGTAWAGDGVSLSLGSAGLAVAISCALVAWIVWQISRTVQRKAQDRTVQQITSLIEHAECLLWEATVELNGEDWNWDFTLHASALSRRLFPGGWPSAEWGLWNRFEIPEQGEMNQRSQEAMKSGRSGYEQQFGVKVDGKIMWVHETVSITSTGPNRFRLVGLATDITAQREAELTKRASQEQLQQLLNHANCMLWQADVTRDAAGEFNWEWFVPRSELYRRMAGENHDQKAIMPWGTINVPEFPELEIRSRDAMQRGLPGYEQVFRVIQGDKVSWMHEQATITHLGPAHWKIEGVVIDITAQRRAEEAKRAIEKQLDQMLERADCTIWQARVTRMADGNLDWNLYIPTSQLYRRIHGPNASPSDGFSWDKLGVPESEEMRKRSRRAILGNDPGYEQLFHVPRADRDLWLVEQVTIGSAGFGIWDLVGIITDVTGRHEAEEARRASDAQLQQVLELADCMVWSATVTENSKGEFNWSLKTQRSVLYRRLFGDGVVGNFMNWHTLNVPELSEMEQRFAHAFRTRASGYDQVFRVITPLKVTWLHETVTLMFLGDGQARLVGVITDVSMQREALEARRASEHQIQQMLTTAECLLWQARVFTVSAEELRWVLIIPPSRLYRELFGADPSNPPVLLWLEVVEAATSEELNARSTEAIKSGAPGYEQEFRAQRGKRVFWLHEQVAITKVGPGEWSLVGVITDLSARREAEQSVRDSEVRFRSLFQHTPVAIVETDFRGIGQWLEGIRQSGVTNLAAWLDADPKRLHDCARRVKVSSTNETATRMFRAKRPSDFRRRRSVLSTPDAMLVIRATMLELWEERNTLESQLAMHDFEGNLHFMNVRWWVARTEDGLDLSQSLLVFVDLTELKQAEAALATEKERLAVTLRAMAEGVVTTDVAGVIQFMNPAAAALTQWNEDAIGRPIAEICALENERPGTEFKFPVERSSQYDLIVELPAQTRLVTRNGQRRSVDGCCAPIHSADSKVIGMVFVFRDVTEHERLEQELVRATRLESVGVLAGGIAHDFNNILTGVMGNLALAQMDIEAKSEVGVRLREAEKATLRARDLTQQLLTFAKGGEPIRSAVQLDAIVRETAMFALHGSNVKPVFHLPGELWPADADKGQISRVVQNLVINAIQAMPAGGTLRLTAHNEAVSGQTHPGLVAGNYVQIEIADTGEGISAEHLPRIFDPYFTTKKSGSGLGLAAVYSIIKKHGGHIDVESTIGRGTTFRFWLPALIAEKVITAPPMPVMNSKFNGRVLFMDDEEVIRRMAVMMLERLGFEVECAADGAEAVEKFGKAQEISRPFALVIMDLTIPGGMGGREAIAHLRKIDPQVKAIVSSGYSSDPVLANYRTHGFCGVVAKPYRLDDFVQALRDALHNPLA